MVKLGAGTVLMVLLLAGLPAWSQTYGVLGGWTHTDAGLADKGEGFFLSAGGRFPLGNGPFSLLASVDILRNSASQTMLFSDPLQGNILGAAEVTLTSVQPALAVALDLDAGRILARPYAGLGFPLKVGESWDTPVGEADREYGYEDLDVVVHLGMRLVAGRFLADARMGWGLTEQLAVIGAPPVKADDPLGGESLPEEGEGISTFSLGVGLTF